MNQNETRKTDRQVADLITRIDGMTQENNHTGAICSLAEFVGDNSMIMEAYQISNIHQELGHMPMSLMMRRNSVRDSLFGKFTAYYGWSNAVALRDSF